MIFRNWVLENFPFLEDDFDALTDYQLFCKMLEYVRTIVKNDEDFNKRLTDLENYINNLDLQDEVNNKLDEMAESGELSDIIAQYLDLAGVLAYNTKADMKNAENIANGSIMKTLGDSTYTDGKGRFYKARTIQNTDVIDDINIIALHNPTLVAELIPEDYLTDIENIQEEIEDIQGLIPFACILRPTTDGWTILNDTDHQPLNVDSVAIVNNRLTLYHDNNASKVITFEITPDETFSKYGIRCGASVGIDDTRIDIYQELTCTAYIRYQSGTFTINNDYSNLCSGVEWDDTNKCLVVTFVTNNTEPTSWNTVHSFQASTMTTQLQRKIVTLYADTRVLNIYMYDNDGVQITNKGAFDRLICTYSVNKKIDPSELVVSPLADSNFWVYGLLKS